MSKSPIYCEHANEMPSPCPCKDDCYCKEHSCKSTMKKITQCDVCGCEHFEGVSCPNCVIQNEITMTDINVMKRCIPLFEKTIKALKTQCQMSDEPYDQEIVEYLVDLCFEILNNRHVTLLPDQIAEMGIYVEKLRKQKEVTIIVNGEKKVVEKRTLRFKELVDLIYDELIIRYTSFSIISHADCSITYRQGHPSKPNGILTLGETVHLKDGMIFDIALVN